MRPFRQSGSLSPRPFPVDCSLAAPRPSPSRRTPPDRPSDSVTIIPETPPAAQNPADRGNESRAQAQCPQKTPAWNAKQRPPTETRGLLQAPARQDDQDQGRQDRDRPLPAAVRPLRPLPQRHHDLPPGRHRSRGVVRMRPQEQGHHLHPKAGSIMVIDVNTRRKMPTGHLGYVEEACPTRTAPGPCASATPTTTANATWTWTPRFSSIPRP
jgi:hypothetical protein